MSTFTRITDSWAWITLIAAVIIFNAVTLVNLGLAAQAPVAVFCLTVFAASYVIERVTRKLYQ